MSVIFIGGVPGTGKTLFCTYLAKKKFKKENRFRRKVKINNVFTNFPVRLTNYKIKKKNKDKNVYSRCVSINDFKVFKKHIPDSIYVFDEFHSVIDSLDYKNFPREISKTFQFHRHFGIKDIYVVCQHPSRLVKQVRVLCDEFYKIKKFFKIPLIGVCLFRYDVYYNFDDYGKSTKCKKEEVNYDFSCKFKFFRYKKIFNSYDTKYMNKLVETEPYFESDSYSSLSLSLEDIKNNFNIEK